jgi:hypothetical protein
MAVVEEEESVSMPFSLENGDSWTSVMGSSRFNGKDGGKRIGRNGRAPALGTTMGDMGAGATRMIGFRIAV